MLYICFHRFVIRERCISHFLPKNSDTQKKNKIVFTAPTGEEITTKKQLDHYLKPHPGGPKISEFNWGTGQRSASKSEKKDKEPEETLEKEKAEGKDVEIQEAEKTDDNQKDEDPKKIIVKDTEKQESMSVNVDKNVQGLTVSFNNYVWLITDIHIDNMSGKVVQCDTYPKVFDKILECSSMSSSINQEYHDMKVKHSQSKLLTELICEIVTEVDDSSKVLRILGSVASTPIQHGIPKIIKECLVSGSKFNYLKNEAVLLEMALINWTLSEVMKRGFTPLTTPEIARSLVVYSIEGSDQCLIGTAEIPVGGIHMDSILANSSLPIKYAAFSYCFYTEADAAGAATIYWPSDTS
ncbi:serine--tRNA ligase, chloroplastic/mitochondrial isoform X2 [Tanacetum coccineum]